MSDFYQLAHLQEHMMTIQFEIPLEDQDWQPDPKDQAPPTVEEMNQPEA